MLDEQATIMQSNTHVTLACVSGMFHSSKQHVSHHPNSKSGSTSSGGKYVDYMYVEPPQTPLRMQTAPLDPHAYHQVYKHAWYKPAEVDWFNLKS